MSTGQAVRTGGQPRSIRWSRAQRSPAAGDQFGLRQAASVAIASDLSLTSIDSATSLYAFHAALNCDIAFWYPCATLCAVAIGTFAAPTTVWPPRRLSARRATCEWKEPIRAVV
jgi:hypothetical protein